MATTTTDFFGVAPGETSTHPANTRRSSLLRGSKRLHQLSERRAEPTRGAPKSGAAGLRWSGHGGIVMIGRRRDLVAGTGCRIFSTDDASWTPDRNRAWIADAIRRRSVFVIASALTLGNVRIREHGAYRRTVFALELDQLFAAGYQRDAALLLPPAF